MVINELSYPFKAVDKSCIQSLFSNEYNGLIVRGFLSSDEIEFLRKTYNSYPADAYEVYAGFNSLPRPFDHIKNRSPKNYEIEAAYFSNTLRSHGFDECFRNRLSEISKDYLIHFNDQSGSLTRSLTWASIRELKPDKGSFEIHCGRLFQHLNEEFFSFFSKSAEVDSQLAFLIMLQRPENECDIEVFDLTWSASSTKLDKNTLVSNSGEKIDVNKIPSEKIILNEGDLLLFDEGNYWHKVSHFSGNMSRLSFGGFITKIIGRDGVLVWS
jgi:hypothetical protein